MGEREELRLTQVQQTFWQMGGFLKNYKVLSLVLENSKFPCNLQSLLQVLHPRDFFKAVAGAVQTFLIRKREKEIFKCLFIIFSFISGCCKCFIQIEAMYLRTRNTPM